MSIKEYLKVKKYTLRKMAEECDIHYSTLYRLSVPANHKSARRISLELATKIVRGTNNAITLEDLLNR